MSFQRVKYKPKQDSTFFNTLKKRVDDAFNERTTKQGNITMYVKSICMILAYFAPFTLMLVFDFESIAVVLGIWAVMGFAMAGIGLSIMHDANHGAYFKSTKPNNWMGLLVNFVGGSAFNWKIQHNILHHTYTNITGLDEDIHPIGLLRFSPHEELKPIHKYQHLYAWLFYGLMTIEWTTTKDFNGLIRYNKMGLVTGRNVTFKKELIKLILWKIFYLLYIIVLPIIVLKSVPFWVTIVGFVSMHFIAGLMLGMIFQPAHVMETSEFPVPDSDHEIDNNWAIHQLYTTANFAPNNFLLNWYAGGLNYQIEHHLFPTICHVHYKRISKIVQETAKEYGLPYHVQPTFFSAIWNHGKMLKKLGRA